MSEPLVLALDQGTTSTRAILFRRSGEALAEASRHLDQSYPQDGWVEHDAEVIFRDSVAVMREAIEAAGHAIGDVACLGITNQRETTVVWDRGTGRPIHPAIVWQDRRTADICDSLRARGVEAEVARQTGLLLDPYFSATKIAWILDAVDGARERAERGELLAGTMDCWLIWNLTGGRVHATDATNASRTLLMDLDERVWSDALCDLFRVPRGLLPEIRDTAGDFGQVEASILGGALPISGVAGDQQAALMGQGCVRAGEAKATYGTGCFMLLHTGETAPRSSARLLTTVAAQLKGRATYALEGSIFIAGAAVQWLGEGLGLAGGPRAAEALARQAKPHHGVVLVPAFTGLGAPYWDPDARGAMFGLTRDSGLAEISAAVFDACAFQTQDLIEAMRLDVPDLLGPDSAAELRIDGGMAQSDWFAQRLADITGVPVACAANPETTALGAALYAGLGSGLFSSPEEAACASRRKAKLAPQSSQAWRTRKYDRWRDAVRRTRVTA